MQDNLLNKGPHNTQFNSLILGLSKSSEAASPGLLISFRFKSDLSASSLSL